MGAAVLVELYLDRQCLHPLLQFPRSQSKANHREQVLLSRSESWQPSLFSTQQFGVRLAPRSQIVAANSLCSRVRAHGQSSTEVPVSIFSALSLCSTKAS